MNAIFEDDRSTFFVIITIISWIVVGVAFAISSFNNGLWVLLIVLIVDTMLLRERKKEKTELKP